MANVIIFVIAIHRAAGPQLREACSEVPEVRPGVRCPTGEARITPLVTPFLLMKYNILNEGLLTNETCWIIKNETGVSTCMHLM